jgi:hypothetical protein
MRHELIPSRRGGESKRCGGLECAGGIYGHVEGIAGLEPERACVRAIKKSLGCMIFENRDVKC